MKEQLTRIEGLAVPLLWDNVDTDALVPAAPHKRINGGGRDGLQEVLFYEFRFTAEGERKPDFSLNDPRFAGAPILLAGDNFGCGSSREVAVWALRDYGFRAVIAKSFAEIFEQNAYKNHLLPATVDASTHARIVAEFTRPSLPPLVIDLAGRSISISGQGIGLFSADEMGLEMLMSGMDEFELTSRYVADIQAAQRRLIEANPWLE